MLFNGNNITPKRFREQMEELGVFQMPAERLNFLTFGSLLSFFARGRKSAYVSYDKPQADWTDYQSVLYQSFLLGLDYHRASKKYAHKTRLDQQEDLAERYTKDKDLREFYLGEKNADVELAELDAHIARLDRDLASFRVADNYAERQQIADELHQQLAELANDTVVLNNLMSDLDLALKQKPDVSPSQIVALFKEATVALPLLVVKRLEDVQAFHARLYENRRERLGKERIEAENQLAALNDKVGQLRHSLDTELQFLNAHKALDEYAANSRHLSDLRGRRQRIQDFQKLLTQYTEEAQRIRAEMAQATVDTAAYLHSIKAHLDLLMARFRSFSQELYGAVASGLTVKNNDGENQCRFNIEVHIQNDAADGINEGKLFCYDLLLLALRQRHSVEFLLHDNRLFAEMDKHQRYSLFKLADRICRELDVQYIATLNEDVVDSVRDIAGHDFQRLFVDPVVLKLTDAPDGRGKLLGIQVDMTYDET